MRDRELRLDSTRLVFGLAWPCSETVVPAFVPSSLILSTAFPSFLPSSSLTIRTSFLYVISLYKKQRFHMRNLLYNLNRSHRIHLQILLILRRYLRFPFLSFKIYSFSSFCLVAQFLIYVCKSSYK